MASKVTFDPINKIIQITQPPVDGVVDIDFKTDIYSEGKEDWLSDETLNKLKFPIRAVGGDNISTTKKLGSTFFLQYGWRIRPYETTHRLRIDGNIYTDPFGSSSVVPTTGSHNVIIENAISSITTVEIVGGTTSSVNITSASISDIASSVWDEQLSLHSTVGSSGYTLANLSASSGATPEAIAFAVWNDTASLYTTPSSFGYILADLSRSVYISSESITNIVNSIWDEQLSLHSTIGSAGYIISNISSSISLLASPLQIAQAVWNDTASLYSVTSSFGYILANSTQSVYISSSSISQMTNAVWNEQLSTYIIPGSAGYALSNVSAGASPALIAQAVWNDTASLYTNTSSFGYAITSQDTNLQLILGLVQHNFRMTNQIYDANGNMTSAEVNIYPTSADANAETNAINTYYITAVYDGDNRLIDYKMVE